MNLRTSICLLTLLLSGLATTAGELNPDAVVEPDALVRMGAALAAADPRCVAVAPKMLLAADPTVIDAVGNAVNAKGEAFNIGLGQPDLGQFDVPGPCFGPCFGAAMFRRSAFAREHVGPLDESLFLYYEDVDWNWRSQLLGYTSVTEPYARVRHVMSAATRHLDYGFKFHLTERNLLICVLKNFTWRRALAIWFRRGADLLNSYAMVNLARYHWEGRGGLALDKPAAVSLWRRAIYQDDNPWAQVGLAEAFEKGEGAARDETEALRLYRAAAAQEREPQAKQRATEALARLQPASAKRP